MRLLNVFIIFIISILLLSGCGTDKFDDGVKDMKEILSEMKQQLENNDQTKVQSEANELDESWEEFEDTVKDKSIELYEKAETPLHLIIVGVKSSPLDATTLNKAIDELDQVLTEIENLK